MSLGANSLRRHFLPLLFIVVGGSFIGWHIWTTVEYDRYWEQGQQAGIRNQPVSACPAGTARQRTAWLDGWHWGSGWYKANSRNGK